MRRAEILFFSFARPLVGGWLATKADVIIPLFLVKKRIKSKENKLGRCARAVHVLTGCCHWFPYEKKKLRCTQRDTPDQLIIISPPPSLSRYRCYPKIPVGSGENRWPRQSADIEIESPKNENKKKNESQFVLLFSFFRFPAMSCSLEIGIEMPVCRDKVQFSSGPVTKKHFFLKKKD